MENIKLNDKVIMDSDCAILIGLKEEKKVQIHYAGSMSLDEGVDMLNTAMYEFITSFLKHAGGKKDVKEEIYNRVVMAFSLMIDKFYPEGVKNKFNDMIDKATLKAQDEMIKKEYKK